MVTLPLLAFGDYSFSHRCISWSDGFGREQPPAITHPEYFYGFAGVALAWLVAFLIIGRDPVRYRPLIIPSMVEKFSFAVACAVLYLHSRISAKVFGSSMIDLALGICFVIAYAKTSTPRTT